MQRADRRRAARRCRAAPRRTTLARTTVIYARGDALFRTTARGKGETELAKLPAKRARPRAAHRCRAATCCSSTSAASGRGCRSTASASTLTELPCGDGPAQLAERRRCACSAAAPRRRRSVIVNLAHGKVTPSTSPRAARASPVTAPSRRLVLGRRDRRVERTAARRRRQRRRSRPRRHCAASCRAPTARTPLGVYTDIDLRRSRKHTKPADVLMGFALDGQAVEREHHQHLARLLLRVLSIPRPCRRRVRARHRGSATSHGAAPRARPSLLPWASPATPTTRLCRRPR